MVDGKKDEKRIDTEGEACILCGGTGRVRKVKYISPTTIQEQDEPMIISQPCSQCHGTGHEKTEYKWTLKERKDFENFYKQQRNQQR